MEVTFQPHALYTLVRKAPIMVDRRWPTWNDLAMFGDEYSMTTVFPFPVVFVPYSGSFDAVWCVSSVTCVKISRTNVGVVHLK